MRRMGSVAALAMVWSAALARADVAAPPPLPERVAQAGVIVVGKVTGFGDKLVSAVPPYGGNKVDYQIAIVQISDAILGAKDMKEIKVAFVPIPTTGPRLSHYAPTLKLDEEAILFLTPHPDESFYLIPNYYDVVARPAKPEAFFDKMLDEVKRLGKLLADPDAGFQSKDANERFLTAAMLVTRYRPRIAGKVKAEAVDAERSKQILNALADADWSAKPALVAEPLSPQRVFLRLGLTEKDGWTTPTDLGALPEAAKKWLKDNAEKYRVQRLAADKGEK